MNQPDTKERALQAEITADTKALDEAADVGRKFENAAKAELSKLEAELPAAMLAFVRGADGARRLEIRNRIRELKADLEELPALDQGFERERAKIQSKRNQERMARNKRTNYERLKESLLEDPRSLGIATRDDLNRLAKHLDCEGDAVNFLAGLEKGAAA